MKLSEFLVKSAISLDLDAVSKDEALRETVRNLESAGCLPSAEVENVIKSLVERERLGSTGIGRGLAVPHARHAAVTKLTGTISVSRKGVNFDSLDGEPVYIMVLLISPPNDPGRHLRALELIIRRLKDEVFSNTLRQLKSADDLWEFIEETDAKETPASGATS